MRQRPDKSNCPQSFWREESKQYPGAVIYNWKIEHWNWEAQPAHRQAQRDFAKKGYPALPDEDLGFFYDPKRVVYQSANKIAIDDPETHYLGDYPKEEQTWEALNEIQGWCFGCEVQQLRGMFFGEDFIVKDMRSRALPSEFNTPRLVPRASIPSCGGKRTAFQHSDPVKLYSWKYRRPEWPPQGAYVAVDPYGGWRHAEPVCDERYNSILREVMIKELKHRQQNEERLRRELGQSGTKKRLVDGSVVYTHPLFGRWSPLLIAHGSSPRTEVYFTMLPPLSSDLHPTNLSRPLKSWLQLADERRRQRSKLQAMKTV